MQKKNCYGLVTSCVMRGDLFPLEYNLLDIYTFTSAQKNTQY